MTPLSASTPGTFSVFGRTCTAKATPATTNMREATQRWDLSKFLDVLFREPRIQRLIMWQYLVVGTNYFCLVHNKILLLIVQTLPWSPSPNDLFGMGVRNAEAEYVMLIVNVDWNCWFPATRAAKAGSHSKLWFNYSSYPQRRYWSISVDETHIWFVNQLFWWNPHRPRVHPLPNSNTRISSSVRVVKSPFHAVSILVPLDCHANARLSQYSGCAAVGWSQLKLIKQRAPWM